MRIGHTAKHLSCMSDHNMVHLLPKYKQKLKQTKPVVKEVRKWNQQNIEALQCCFETTNWDIFTVPDSIDATTEVITDYIKFCEDLAIPKIAVKIYPNNKPWLNKELQELLKQKQRAHANDNHQEKHELQKEIKKVIRRCKSQYGQTENQE